jgi:hypothetical protein
MKIKQLLVALLLAAPLAAWAQAAGSAPADNMQILREKLKADKKLVVAANLDLTEAEAKGFWPIYEDYQKQLHKVNDQIAMLLVDYGKQYQAGKLGDAQARALLDQYFGIEEAEVKLKRSFVPRLAKVLPGAKVARYMQLENKIRALVKYELAAEVPLAR